jgi:hypothetical protein
MPSVIMLSVKNKSTVLNIIMLSVVMLNVVMLNVVAPQLRSVPTP